MSKRPDVLICQGSNCTKCKAKRAKLVEALTDVAKVRKVGCQKVCKGPVAGVEVDGKLEWFAELDSGKARRALMKLLQKGRVGKTLEKRRAKKRCGQRR